MGQSTYEKPVVYDYGSLTELTEACGSSGLGDFAYKNNNNFTTFISGSAASTCGSSGNQGQPPPPLSGITSLI